MGMTGWREIPFGWLARKSLPEGLESRLQCQGSCHYRSSTEAFKGENKATESGVGIACDAPGTGRRTLCQEYVSKGTVIREKQGPCGP